MIRITPQTSAQAAKSYQKDHLARGDYYMEGGELAGRWGGRGAELLGLRSETDQRSYHALCDNFHPATGEALTQRTKGNRRVAYDFTFNAPKPVSVLNALTGDAAILDAYHAAVRETMADIERDAEARVRRDGAHRNRGTGNLVWGEFTHLTTRPIDGVPDMHLHTHCVVFNATFDAVERRWKAAELGRVKADAPYYEALFHNRLADGLARAGYGIERRGKGWTVTGIPDRVVTEFSRRTAEIEAEARRLGISGSAKADLGARTRRRKQRGLSQAALETRWAARVTPEELAAIRGAKGRGGTASAEDRDRAVRDAVALAARDRFERASVVEERDLIRAALRFATGTADARSVQEFVQHVGFLRRQEDGRTLMTTADVLGEEKAMIAFARDGRNAHAPLKPGPHEFRDARLNPQQRAAVGHVLSSPDRVMVVRGGAGTGKTTLMSEAIPAIEAAGRKVVVLAPSAEASRGVLRSEGFAGADTVARFLQDTKLQERSRGGVIWVDEAGLMGVRAMCRLFRVAEKQNARIILSGDVRQHGAVERGDALRLLESEAGVKPAAVEIIQRQKGQYRAAVAALRDGKLAEGMERLDSLGAVREVPAWDGHKAIARDYLDGISAGKSMLAVSPTHAEGAKVTAEIRSGLREAGKLGPGRVFQQLRDLQATEAERRDAASYTAGQVVQFHQHAKGFRNGERVTVIGRDPRGRVLVGGADKIRVLPLDQAAHFGVFEQRAVEVAAGDLVRITRNGKTPDRQRLNNGAVYRVAGFTAGGDLRLENGWTVPSDYGHLTHGYCVTSHASQGRTVDRVLIAQGAASFPASFRQQFYVAVSRARERVQIYTDDREGLLRAVSRSGERRSATELMKPERTRHVPLAMRANRMFAEARARTTRQAAALRQRVRAAMRPRGREREREMSHGR